MQGIYTRYKLPLRKNNARVVSATEVISSGADGILPESALEGFAEYDSADPVDTFVNAIFLYDDKMVLTYNFRESTETITFGELQEVLPNGFRGSDMNLATEPETYHPNSFPNRNGFGFFLSFHSDDFENGR